MQPTCTIQPPDTSDTSRSPAITPVSQARHGRQGWHRFRSYGFARTRTELPLALAETDPVAASFPILFRDRGDGPAPVVVLDPAGRGTVPVVAPDGRWCAPYVPSALRAHPFDMADGPDGAPVLTVDEGAGLISDESTGLAFFETTGALAPELRHVHGFLRTRRASQDAARLAAHALARAGLLCPLAHHPEQGVMGIDDAALMACDADTLAPLWQNGALRLALAQRVSLHHMGWLMQAGTQPPCGGTPAGIDGFLSAFVHARAEECA